MSIDRDGDGPTLRRTEGKVSLTPGEGRGDDLRATAFTDNVFDDDYYGRRARGSQGSRSFSVVVGVVLGIAAAGGLGFYFLGGSGMKLTPGEVSFVKADPSPYKIRPENPGGLQVANQDKLVYDRIAKGDAPARVENLLPPAEEPKAPPMKPKVEEPVAAPASDLVSNPVSDAVSPPVASPAPPAALAAPEPDPLIAAVAAATGGRTSATGPIGEVSPEAKSPEDQAPQTDAPVQTATAEPTPGGAYQVQLASVLSEQAALAEWGRISGKNKDILGAYAPTVTRADLGDRGVFFRLRTGPLADKAAADALCASLAAANVGCIVVKP